MSFVADVDEGYIEALINELDPNVFYAYPESVALPHPDTEGLNYNMSIAFTSAVYGAGHDNPYCTIYRLTDGSGYYFYTNNPDEMIRFK